MGRQTHSVPSPVKKQQSTVKGPHMISDKQQKLLFVKTKQAGWTPEEMKTYLAGIGINSSSEIPYNRFDDVLKALDFPPPSQDTDGDLFL